MKQFLMRITETPQKIIIIVIAFTIALWINLRAISTASMEYDESHWIHTSTYYEVLLTQPVNSSYWDEVYWTLTQPPMARYLIGFSRSLFGINSSQLNKPWDFDLTYEENVKANNLPSAHLLYVSRLPMAILSAGTVTLIFILLFQGAGLFAGAIFLFLYGINTYLISSLVRAMGDPPFIFFITFSAFICYLAVREYQLALKNHGIRKYTKSYVLFFLAAFLCGLGGASKINGLLSCGGILLVMFVQTIFFAKNLTDQARFSLIIRFSFLIIMASLFAFIIINPFLYPDPFARIGRMYKFRFEEMSIQMGRYPESVISGFGNRIYFLFIKVLPSSFPFQNLAIGFVNLVFIVVGGYAMIKAYILGQIGDTKRFAPFVIAVIFFPLAFAGFLTPLSWGRYLLPCIVFNLICISVGINAMVFFLIGRQKAKEATTIEG